MYLSAGIITLTWFSRPGVASVFTPNLGTVRECNTSAAVTVIRAGEFIGSTAGPTGRSFEGIGLRPLTC